MDLSQKLVQLGFSKNQAAVYSALIDLGQCKASEIIKKTGLHRNIVYEALDDLVLKKLAFKTSKGGVALFQLSDANTLIDDVQLQLSLAQEVSKEINTAREKSSHEIKIYEGMEGFKAHYASIIHEMEHTEDPQELLILASNQATEQLTHPFFRGWDQQREEKKLKAKILFPVSKRAYAEELEGYSMTDTKLLPHAVSDPVGTRIWNDNVSFMLSDHPPFLISIKNKRFADSFREHFHSLWNQEAKVYRGVEGMKLIMDQSLKHQDNWFIGGNGGIGRVMPEYWEEYNKHRIEKGVWWHDLVDDGMYLPGIQALPPGVRDEERQYEFKWLPQEVSSPSVIFMYGNTVANIIWDEQPEPIAFVIENADVFHAYRKYFDYLWAQQTFVTRGLQNVQQLFYRKLATLSPEDAYAVLWANYGHEIQEQQIPFFKKYHTERARKKVRVQLLGFESDRALLRDEVTGGSGDAQRTYSELRFLQEKMPSPMQILLYPDSLVIVHWVKDAVAIEIQRKDIRDAMLLYFQSLWKTAKK